MGMLNAGFGPYPERPSEVIIRQLYDSIVATQNPEGIFGVTFDPAAENSAFEILCEFQLIQNKRLHSDRVQCYICGERNKFLNGYLTWWPDGYLRLVGHECGGRHLDELVDAKVRFKNRRLRRIAEDIIVDVVPRLPAVISSFSRLLPIASELQLAYQDLKRASFTLMRQFRQIADGNGEIAFEHIPEEGSESEKSSKPDGKYVGLKRYTFGYLTGSKFILHGASLHDCVSKSFRSLRDLHYCKMNEDEILAHLTEEKTHVIVQGGINLKRFLSNLYEKALDTREAGQFFQKENLVALSQWAAHPHHSLPVDFLVEAGRLTIRDMMLGTSVVNVPKIQFSIDLLPLEQVLRDVEAIEERHGRI